MPTEYKITEIKTVEKTSHLYLIVEFYVNGSLTHTDDFIIGRPAENRVYTGRVGPDGEILDPDAYDISPLDIKAEIQNVIRTFEKSHRNDLLVGRRTNRTGRIRANNTDPFGFIARPEVQAIKNVSTKI